MGERILPPPPPGWTPEGWALYLDDPDGGRAPMRAEVLPPAHRLYSCDEAARCARPGECSSPNPFNEEGTCAVGGIGVWLPPCCMNCPRCDGEGRVRVEVIYNGDQSYEDVEDCDACGGSGERGGHGSGSGRWGCVA